jgi:hypothetical protein
VGAGSAFIRPGSRKVAGDTLWVALNPLQPEVSSKKAMLKTPAIIFQFNLTEPHYKVKHGVRNNCFEGRVSRF